MAIVECFPIPSSKLCNAIELFMVLTLVFHAVKYTYRLWFHPLSSYPGPFVARMSSIWVSSEARKLRRAHAIQTAHEKYGPVVRIAPNELSFANPNVLKDIYGHGLKLPKAEFYEGGKFTSVDSVFSMRDRHQHGGRRSLMAKAFSLGNLTLYIPMMCEKLRQTMDQLESRSKAGSEPLNIYNWVHWYALDVVFNFVLDNESGTLKTGKDHPVIRHLESFQSCFTWMSLVPALRNYGRFIPIRSIREPFEHLNNWIQFAVHSVQIERNNDKVTALMKSLIENQDPYLGRRLTDIEIAEELLSFFFAGSGTAANTTVFLIWSVLRNSDIKRKLVEEIRSVMPTPMDFPEYSTINKLPYTNSVIMEALRRYPTIPGTQPRCVVEKPIQLEGQMVPVGTIVGVQNYTIHRHADTFPSPEEFVPERWLAEDTKDQRAAFNGFGTGPRACLGRNLAMLELQYFVMAFFSRFDATISETMTDEEMIMTDGFSGGPAGEKLELCLKTRIP